MNAVINADKNKNGGKRHGSSIQAIVFNELSLTTFSALC